MQYAFKPLTAHTHAQAH